MEKERRRNASLIGLLALLIVASLFFYLQVTSPSKNTEQRENGSSSIPWDSMMGPAPFDLIANVVPLDDAINQLAERGLAVYLPTNLPNDYELTAIYAVVEDGEIGNSMMVCWSNSGDASMRSAEIVFDIYPGGMPYHVSDSSRDRFIQVGDWKVFVCERAPVGFYEYYKKYGTEYAILLDLVIAGLNYEFRFSPTLTLENAIDIVSSMRQARTGSP